MLDTDIPPAAPADATTTTTAPAEPQSPAPQADPAPTAAPAGDPATPDPDDDGPDPADEASPRKKGGGFQTRIDKLTREKYEAELRAQTYQRELEALRKQGTQDDTRDPGDMPGIDQFATVEAFQQAVADWGVRKGRFEAHQGGSRRRPAGRS